MQGIAKHETNKPLAGFTSNSYFEIDHLVRGMDNLSVGALRILITAYNYCLKTRMNRFNFLEISSKLTDLDPFLIMQLINELHSANLVCVPGAPRIPTQDYADYHIELTELGRRIMETSAL